MREGSREAKIPGLTFELTLALAFNVNVGAVYVLTNVAGHSS